MPAKKILVVDDEQGIRDVLEQKLTADGFEVLLATTGQEAIDQIFSQHPDLVLMDIVLPDIEGSEIVKRLQQDTEMRKIPIIFLSGIVTRENGKFSSQVTVGGWEYRALAKPFSYRELRDQMDGLLKFV